MALWLPLGPTLSVEFWFFLACLFSRGLFWFLTKNWKTSRKPKNKKIDAIWPNGYILAPHSLWSFVFFGLCVFSGSCGLFRCLTKKWQKPRENKQQKNKALDRMALWLPLGPTSSVELFVSRCFFVWFLAEIVAKTSRKQKNTKLSTLWPYGYPWPHIFCGFFFDGKNLEKTKKTKLSTLWPVFWFPRGFFFHQTSNMAKTSKTKKK